ncbi:hypothetical protein NLB25_27385, partial [Klebsiella pneumoniae]|nr:hypothetical protein [Klebsiella pneumoniae]
LFRTLAQEVLGTTKVTYGEHVFDFGKPFEKLTMREAIKKYRPETDMADLDNFDAAKALAESIGITVEKSWGLGRIVTEIFDEVAEAHLIQPTFITEYPAEVSPLAHCSAPWHKRYWVPLKSLMASMCLISANRLKNSP